MILKNYFYIIERSNSNQGLAFTLNNLISKLGDESFIFRMDSDDLCMPCRFERQILFLLKNSDIDILGSDIEKIKPMGVDAIFSNFPDRI